MDNAKTYVLIIGVGEYPYARGGTAYEEYANPILDNLNQLTSPVISANAFYVKVRELEAAGLWSRPIGKITTLVSGGNLRPTYNNVKKAYLQWKADCNSNENNVAIFFFTGHGLEKAGHYVLLEDFGADPSSIWDGAFDFDGTRRAFSTCVAKTQCFFVDACRKLSADMLTHQDTVRTLETIDLLSADSEYALVIKSAGRNESAYGIPGKPTFFSKALIDALDKFAYTRKEDDWVIETATLSAHMHEFIEIASEEKVRNCESWMRRSDVIIRNPGTPKAKVVLTCSPNEALPFAQIKYENLNSGKMATRKPPKPAPWTIEVDAGIYRFTAEFNGSLFRNASESADAKPFPPLTKILKCKTK